MVIDPFYLLLAEMQDWAFWTLIEGQSQLKTADNSDDQNIRTWTK